MRVEATPSLRPGPRSVRSTARTSVAKPTGVLLGSLALVALALPAAGAGATGASAPDGEAMVSIEQSSGRVGALKRQARWDRVRLELRVHNRLTVPVRDVVIGVSLLVSSGDAGATPIPGWRIEQTLADPLAAGVSEVVIDRPLPVQRRSPPAGAIAYRPEVRSYRLTPPSLRIAAQLIESSAAADQRSALTSYELGPPTEENRALFASVKRDVELALAADRKPKDPGSALRLLLALRAGANLADTDVLDKMLRLPSRVDRGAWGTTILDLANQMIERSNRDDPRLELLPIWARNTFDKEHRVEDVLPDLVEAAILRARDPAVPALVAAAKLDPDTEIRTAAANMLHALGRSTVRTQLSLGRREDRLAVIDVLGRVGGPDAVVALVELVGRHDRPTRAAAMQALEQIGAAAVPPLFDALSAVDHEVRPAIRRVLIRLASRASGAVEAAAVRYGVKISPGTPPEELVDAVSDRLVAVAAKRWQAELRRGLDLGRQARFREAFEVLDAVYAANPSLYMGAKEEIAVVYFEHARTLYAAGNYDAARDVVRVGQSVRATERAERLLVAIQVALAEGFLELDAVERAEAALRVLDPRSAEAPEVRQLRGRLLRRRAQMAISAGDLGRARRLVDQARSAAPTDPETERAHTALLLRENLIIVAGFGLFIPALVIALAVRVRRRIAARRMTQLESQIDGG